MSSPVNPESLLPEEINPPAPQPTNAVVEVSGVHNGTTDSHALAVADHEEKGAAQITTDVKNLGWNEPPEEIPKPLVGGLPNDDLWTLIRRFNKQMYHVKTIDYTPPGRLDLNISDDEEFSPDKLRSNVERLYMTVIIGMATFAKHMARLQSWNERTRTSAFCAAYFIAWFLNLLVPSFISLLIILIVFPPSRSYLFPPAPLALVSAKTGSLKKPTAGVLGTHDTLTGAPEKHPGEAVEQEASHFYSGFVNIAMSGATGVHRAKSVEEENDGESALEGAVPNPTKLASHVGNAQAFASGNGPTAVSDRTKKPMENAMWEQARPFMHILTNIVDGWERFANALSPTPPFHKNSSRLKLAGMIAPLFVVSLLVNSAMFMKGTTFIIGTAFFSTPVTTRAIEWLNKNYPNWPELLELRRTVLKGVPTNAQLTLTLLRIGEANKAPLPPPPVSKEVPIESAPVDDLPPLDASEGELQDAIEPDEELLAEEEAASGNSPTSVKPKRKSKLAAFVKGTAKSAVRTGVRTVLGGDHVKAKLTGSESSKNRLGVIPKPDEMADAGPVDFPARFQGKKGHIFLSVAASSPCLSFTPEKLVAKEQLTPDFTIAIAEIREIKKVGGLGWKTKLLVGWALEKEVKDAIEIVDTRGTSRILTAMQMRDELFNRLVAMGRQKWECL